MAYCSICGKKITPETGVSIGRRWFVCNEHGAMIYSAAQSSGKVLLAGVDAALKHKAPTLHMIVRRTLNMIKEDSYGKQEHGKN